MPNVGIVYNLHHGHEHLRRFPELLAQMKPHLLALCLNGMDPDGEKNGRQILPIGAGKLDLQLLRIIRDSDWRGPIGILNHTDLDAEARLRDNLEGLDWLAAQLDGKPAGPRQFFGRRRPHRNTPREQLASPTRQSCCRVAFKR